MRHRIIVALFTTFLSIPISLTARADNSSSADSRPAQWAQPINIGYNLYRITPTLYRSRQPDADAQPLLKQLGVMTVVNFIKESDSKWLADPAVTQVQIPLQTVHIDDADVIKSLRAIETAQQRGPVLMHCKHGQDRTGLIAAMYRIVVQGWTKEQALQEMTHGGYGDEDNLKRGVAYIDKVDVQALKTAYQSGACSTSALAGCSIKGWFQKTDVAGVPTILWRL